ncbi:DUF1963 domain-containing protein [Pelagicoccus mobilis]|uniref:DUF1963 domain-containing protein n=2 Tax=Pelagicoccus mobilis TaxID=415221 RepID=A0A934RW93_9BACT|nr:DUF1963 domain-containing protein [Pelagicoccus mobilis]
MPPDLEWPTWEEKPQSFLAQIDLSEINQTQASFLPSSGYLYFFYDQEQGVWGFDPKDLGGWRVLYTEAAIETFTERPAPAGMEEEYIYKAKAIAPKLIETLPDAQLLPNYPQGDDEEWDAYENKRAALYENQPRHQMFGYCSPAQNAEMDVECQLASNGLYLGDATGYNDPRASELKKNAHGWKLLLQLDTDDDTEWMWGDVGMLYFWIRESDARSKDFSKVWMIFQCS